MIRSIGRGIPRPVEAALAVVGLLVSAPVVGLAAIVLAVTSGWPVFFRQERVGRNGCRFMLYKLRTMGLTGIGPQVTAGDDARVTRVGRFLRKTKLDELPELWNVFKGDMSLIGPRPEVPRYVDLKNALWRCILEARPGIADPVTLRLRNEEELMASVKGDREQFYMETLQPFKLEGYLEYLQRRTWWTDVHALLKTCIAVMFPDKAPLPTLEEIRGGPKP